MSFVSQPCLHLDVAAGLQHRCFLGTWLLLFVKLETGARGTGTSHLEVCLLPPAPETPLKSRRDFICRRVGST